MNAHILRYTNRLHRCTDTQRECICGKVNQRNAIYLKVKCHVEHEEYLHDVVRKSYSSSQKIMQSEWRKARLDAGKGKCDDNKQIIR